MQSSDSRYARSRALLARAQQSLAGGVSSQFRAGGSPHPLFFERAAGARIWDADGNAYTDYALSQGPLLVGHSHPAVLARVADEMARAQLVGGQHRLEVEVAERIRDLVPCAELVRFSLTGTEAVQAALRLARACTGRPRYVKFEGHYHGWLDNVMISVHPSPAEAGPAEAPRSLPESAGQSPDAVNEAIVLPWNDPTALERTLAARHAEIAAVIAEPFLCNTGCIPPEPGYLEGLRALCDRYGILLIFDEVITGFRLAAGGAQEYLGITPDLATFGKALGGGFPIAVLAGKEHYMRRLTEGAVHAGTFNAYTPGMAASAATLDVLTDGVDPVYPRLFRAGQALMAGLRAAAAETGHAVLLQGPGPMFHFAFTAREQIRNYRDYQDVDGAQYARFARGLLDRGVRVIGRGLWYVSTAHTDQDITDTVAAAREVLSAMHEA